ncbi:hydrophobic surface binding protein [Mucidula mucida]|nr:hydrophobic surface binding protein [Mucidula mucida]
MVQLSSFFAALTVVTAVCSAPTKRTVAQVEADIATISTQVTALDNAITAFPDTGGSLINALAIHSSATTLISTLSTATTDTQNTAAFSEADGSTILASVEAFEPTILHALTGIAAKQPAFAALPIGGIPALVLQDLQNLDAGTAAFADALIAKSPADLVDEANEIKSTIGDAFDTAIAAYQ